jgi:aspartate racemase
MKMNKMKTIGLLGGCSWPSTIEYYRLINQGIGDGQTAKILLKNIDYAKIKASMPQEIPELLRHELNEFAKLGPDSIILCNNTLHKYLEDFALPIPLFHAIDLTVEHALSKGYQNILFLATKFTMEDGFFTRALEKKGIQSMIPNLAQRDEVQAIQTKLSQGLMHPEYASYFKELIEKNKNLDAVILACTELPLVITPENSALPIINPTYLQTQAAITHALGDKNDY